LKFGEALRAEREAKNWSREYLERVIKIRSREGEKPVAMETIKAIELGWTGEPRNGTKLALTRIFPKLAGINQQISAGA
jgi:transcriptional regulator with XRE-family HTH domain